MASTWPPKQRARPWPCSSAVRRVPLPQAPPTMTAPSKLNGAVKDSWFTVWMANWLGSRDGRFWAGLPYVAYIAGVRPR